MKKLNVVIFLVCIIIFGKSFVVGATNLKNNNIKNQVNVQATSEKMQNEFDTLLGISKTQDVDVKEIFLKPLELLWLFFKALFIVVAINIIAHIFCKGAFSYTDIIKRRIKARKLNKVLRDLYD